MTPVRWALVAGGFAGALIVIRPGSGLVVQDCFEVDLDELQAAHTHTLRAAFAG